MKKLFYYLALVCATTAVMPQNSYGQTYIKNYAPLQNATTSNVEFDVVTSSVDGSLWIAGTFNDNNGTGIVVTKSGIAGGLVALGTGRVYMSTGFSYIPTDIIEVQTNAAIVTCQVFDGTAIIGGAILSVSKLGAVNWVREYTGTNYFAPFNIDEIVAGTNPIFWVCGEMKDGGNASRSSILQIDMNGTDLFVSDFSNGQSSETFKGLVAIPNQNRALFTGRTSITTANMKAFTYIQNFNAAPTGTAPFWHYRAGSVSRMYGEDILANVTAQRIIVAGAGSASNTNLTPFRPFMYLTDMNGVLQWERTYNITSYPAASSISILNVRQVGNNFYLLGTREVANTYTSFIICTNNVGAPVWARQYPVKVRAGGDAFYTDGNELFFVGYALNPTTNRLVPRIVNTDLNGNIISGATCVTNLACTSTLLTETQTILNLSVANASPAVSTPTTSGTPMELVPNLVCGNTAIRLAQQPSTVSSLTLYPNPATDRLHLQLPEEMEMTRLQVMNLSGQVVMEKSLVAGEKEFELEIAHLPNAMYILKLEGKGAPQIQKFIKE